MKKYISKIMLICLSILLIYSTKSYGVESGTVRMQINEGTAWTNINISESYAECESLNSSTSTLGTSALQAHLTTDADWSAMALFSVSQYGGATSNAPKQTNGNNTGIYSVGEKLIQTTGILNTATSTSTEYVYGLFNEDGNAKKYVRQLPTTKEETNFVGFTDTGAFLGVASHTFYGSNAKIPVSIKEGLFGYFMGGGRIRLPVPAQVKVLI